jgi:hypothetical protein
MSSAQLSLHQIETKIGALTAEEIFFVSAKIAEKIVNQLGPIRTARINAQVIKEKGQTDELITRLLHARLVSKHLSELKSKPFLSDEEAGKLCLAITRLLQIEMTREFSMPQVFLEAGVHLPLTDDEPQTMLKAAVGKVGIDLNMTNVAYQWHLDLKIDQEVTQQKSNLVFALLETSAGVEISKKLFALGELEKEFNKDL